MDNYLSDSSYVQYVDLAGVVGLFIKVDLSMVEDAGVENYLVGLSPQVRHLIRQGREGQGVIREQYVVMGDKGGGGRKGRQTQCRYCDEIFHCRPDLISHQTRVHPSLPVRAGKRARRPCPQCNKMVINLTLHIRNKHETDPVNVSDGMAQCRLCAETYPANTDHQPHCRLSPVCPECNKTFSQWRVMNKHRKIVHMGMKITCPHCSKTYHDSQSLKKHIDAVHLKIKRLCPLCGASVTALAVHMNSVHTGVKNFPCPECGKKFKSNYDLNRHRDTVHLGNKPCCPFCGKHLANIRQHIRVVHKQIRFPCTICKKQMTTKAELRKHYAKSHYSIGGEPVIESRTGNPNIEPDEGGIYHNSLQKELSDEQLIAQYLGKQQFSMPEAEHSELVIKPDLDHLINGQQRQPHHQLQLKPEPVHEVLSRDQQGLSRDQLIRNQGLTRDQLIRNDQELSREQQSLSREQLVMRVDQTLSREQLVMRNDQGLQREQHSMRTNDELNRHHQQLPQQTHHLVPKHELDPSQGNVLLSRSGAGSYPTSLDKYTNIDKYSSHLVSTASQHQQFWSQGPALPTVTSANGVHIQQGGGAHHQDRGQPAQTHPGKLKQNL